MSFVLEGQKFPTTAVTWCFATFNYPSDTTYGAAFSSQISDLAQQAVIQSAFNRWQSVSGLQFTLVADGPNPANTAGIRVGFGALTGATIGTSFYGAHPDTIVELRDPGLTPLVAVGSTLNYQGLNATLYQVALHEIGHGLGLGHDVTDITSIMNQTASTANPDLNSDDIAGIQSLYGSPANARVVLQGAHSDYVINAMADGSVQVNDTVAGRDGVINTTGVATLAFADGSGVADASNATGDIYRLYQAAFNRTADLPGLTAASNAYRAGTATLADIAQSFTSSPEFLSHYQGLSNDAFVRALYQNVLGRPGDADGVASADRVMDAGINRGQTVVSLAGSFENVQRTAASAGSTAAAEAYRLYQAAFNRAPDAGGLQSSVFVLSTGTTALQLAQSFTASAEFQAAYAGLSPAGIVGQMYQNVLHRAGEASGIAYGANQISGGTSVGQLLLGFSDSSENRANTAGATHDGWVFLG